MIPITGKDTEISFDFDREPNIGIKFTTNRFIEKPKGGWKPNTFYLVQCAMSSGNPLHENIMYTGFLNEDGSPGNYSGLLPTNGFDSSETPTMVHQAVFIRVLAELGINDRNECWTGMSPLEYIKKARQGVDYGWKNKSEKGFVSKEIINDFKK